MHALCICLCTYFSYHYYTNFIISSKLRLCFRRSVSPDSCIAGLWCQGSKYPSHWWTLWSDYSASSLAGKGKKHHSTQFSSFIKECTKAKFKISNFLSASLNANELKQRPLLICNWVWHMKILKYLNCYELDTDFDRSLNLLRFYLSLFMRGKNWINETALLQLQTTWISFCYVSLSHDQLFMVL